MSVEIILIEAIVFAIYFTINIFVMAKRYKYTPAMINNYPKDIQDLLEGKRVIIAAHGNSLRGLIKYLDDMTDEEIIKLELQTGNPICYELDDN